MHKFVTVKDFENYKVFDYGIIYSIPRFEPHRNGGKRFRDGRVLKFYNAHNGYKRCILYKNGKMYNKFVHRVILESFHPRPSNKFFVNHKNGLKADNRLENLEWMTCSQNTRHGYDNGLMNPPYGIKHHNHKLIPEQIKEIRKRRNNGETYRSIAKDYPIVPGSIRKICLRKAWTHLHS